MNAREIVMIFPPFISQVYVEAVEAATKMRTVDSKSVVDLPDHTSRIDVSVVEHGTSA